VAFDRKDYQTSSAGFNSCSPWRGSDLDRRGRRRWPIFACSSRFYELSLQSLAPPPARNRCTGPERLIRVTQQMPEPPDLQLGRKRRPPVPAPAGPAMPAW
jgi:hypothetical protein